MAICKSRNGELEWKEGTDRNTEDHGGDVGNHDGNAENAWNQGGNAGNWDWKLGKSS